MSTHARVAYADLDLHPLVAAVDRSVADTGDPVAAAALARELFALRAPLRGALAELVVASTGPFAALAAAGGLDASRRALAADELHRLGVLTRFDLGAHLGGHGHALAVDRADGTSLEHMPAAARALQARLVAAEDWGAVAQELADFHASEGTGAVALHRVLAWDAGELRGVTTPDGVTVSDLVGGEERRAPLRTALAAFVDGSPAVDALIYGPPGTGKTTAVRALAAEFGDRGLRLIRLDRRDVHDLRQLIAAVAGGPRCLILLDDLVFDEGDRADRELRGVLEGDVSARPGNVLVWATSNRMRLLHETRDEREQDLEGELGRGERSALATRFGLRVAFPALTVEDFVEVARTLVRRRTGGVDADVEAAARRFAVDRGLTPRAARQFADLVASGVVAGLASGGV